MNQDLSIRVDRLLRTKQLGKAKSRRFRAILTASTIVTVCAVVVLLLRPDTLHSVHELLEVLTH